VDTTDREYIEGGRMPSVKPDTGTRVSRLRIGLSTSPELVTLLVDALEEEGEELVGRPSLYMTLDRIAR